MLFNLRKHNEANRNCQTCVAFMKYVRMTNRIYRKSESVRCGKCNTMFKRAGYTGRHIRLDYGIEDGDTIDSLIRPCEPVRPVKCKSITFPKSPKTEKIERPHPMKGKMKVHTSGAQRLKALKLHREDPKSNYAPRYSISRWKKQEEDLLKRPAQEPRSKNYFLKKEDDTR